MNPQKQTLYDTEWQILRVNLLKQNQQGSGFTDDEGTRGNIALLQKYLGSSPSSDRLWRVLNLLNAVRMGNSGQGKANASHDLLIVKFRDAVQESYNKTDKKFSPPTDEQTKLDLAAAPTVELQKVAKNLGIRRKLHASSPHRPELSWYLNHLSAELASRGPNA